MKKIRLFFYWLNYQLSGISHPKDYQEFKREQAKRMYNEVKTGLR